MLKLNLRLGLEKRVLNAFSIRYEQRGLHSNDIQSFFKGLEELTAADVDCFHLEEEIIVLDGGARGCLSFPFGLLWRCNVR